MITIDSSNNVCNPSKPSYEQQNLGFDFSNETDKGHFAIHATELPAAPPPYSLPQPAPPPLPPMGQTPHYIPNPNPSYVNTGYVSSNQQRPPIHVITVPYRRRRPLNICGIVFVLIFLAMMYWMWRTGYNEFKEFRDKHFKD